MTRDEVIGYAIAILFLGVAVFLLWANRDG